LSHYERSNLNPSPSSTVLFAIYGRERESTEISILSLSSAREKYWTCVEIGLPMVGQTQNPRSRLPLLVRNFIPFCINNMDLLIWITIIIYNVFYFYFFCIFFSNFFSFFFVFFLLFSQNYFPFFSNFPFFYLIFLKKIIFVDFIF